MFILVKINKSKSLRTILEIVVIYGIFHDTSGSPNNLHGVHLRVGAYMVIKVFIYAASINEYFLYWLTALMLLILIESTGWFSSFTQSCCWSVWKGRRWPIGGHNEFYVTSSFQYFLKHPIIVHVKNRYEVLLPNEIAGPGEMENDTWNGCMGQIMRMVHKHNRSLKKIVNIIWLICYLNML